MQINLHWTNFHRVGFTLFIASGLWLLIGKQGAQAATRHVGTHPAVSAQTDGAQAMQLVQGMLDDTEEALAVQADDYWTEGDYPRLISVDRVITAMDPGDVNAYSDAGWLMDSDGDTKDAEAYYQLGVANNPTSTFMAYQLAFFYFNSVHEYNKAITVLKRSTQLPGAQDVDYKLLAHSYTHAKEYKNALLEWEIIKQKFPTADAVEVNLQEAKTRYAQYLAGSAKPTTAGK